MGRLCTATVPWAPAARTRSTALCCDLLSFVLAPADCVTAQKTPPYDPNERRVSPQRRFRTSKTHGTKGVPKGRLSEKRWLCVITECGTRRQHKCTETSVTPEHGAAQSWPRAGADRVHASYALNWRSQVPAAEAVRQPSASSREQQVFGAHLSRTLH